MSLNENDKAIITSFWGKAASRAAEIGTESLGRMLVVYPQTKIYFKHWKDLSMGSAKVEEYGIKVVVALNEAVGRLDDLKDSLLDLSQMHAFKLRVDPGNFKIISHNILVVLAIMFPDDFTAEVHLAMDKFLAAVARGLSERYR